MRLGPLNRHLAEWGVYISRVKVGFKVREENGGTSWVERLPTAFLRGIGEPTRGHTRLDRSRCPYRAIGTPFCLEREAMPFLELEQPWATHALERRLRRSWMSLARTLYACFLFSRGDGVFL